MSWRMNLRAVDPVWRRRARRAALVVLLAGGSAAAFLQAERVRSQLIEETTVSSDALVQAALRPELTVDDALTPATGTRHVELASVIQRQIRADGTVRAVTIWAPDGTVLFADDTSLVGQEVRSIRPTVLAVLSDEARSDVARGLLRTFVPVDLGGGIAVAVQLDRSFDPIRSASDPWRLIGLIAGSVALLAILLLIRTFTRYGRRAEGFDEDTLRAAIAARRRAERERREAEERRDQLEGETQELREAARAAQARERDAAKAATDAPRLREHLASTAEDLRRSEEEVASLKAQLEKAERAVQAGDARGRDELASALAEIERLEEARAGVADRAAKAEEEVARLNVRVTELQARPDVETEILASRRALDEARQALEGERVRAEHADRRARELEEELAQVRATIRELESRTDQSAKLDAATEALEIAREQIRALTTRADEAEAEAARLRGGSDERLAALSAEIEQTNAALAQVRAELEASAEGLRRSQAEAGELLEELESMRRQTDASEALLSDERAELAQAAERMKALTARAEGVELALEEQRQASEAIIDQLRRELASARAELEQQADLTSALQEAVDALEASMAETRFARAQAEVAREASEAASTELSALRDERAALHAELTRTRDLLQRTQTELAETSAAVEALTARSAAPEAEVIRGQDVADGTGAPTAEVQTLRADLEEARRHSDAQQDAAGRRIAELEVEISRIAELEVELAEAQERARRAEQLLADARTPLEGAGEAPAETGTDEAAQPPLAPPRAIQPAAAGPDDGTGAPTPEEIVSEAPATSVNGVRSPVEVASAVEVDALVRRVVEESWSDRGRMFSIYAESVTVEAVPEHVEGILGAMLERAIERTTAGNRLVIHVEREQDGALLSIEDGRPASEDAMSPEAYRLATLCGGWASVEAHPGGGAIFQVWLPPAAPAVQAARPA